MVKKIITIVYDLIVIGKSAASDIQLSGDKSSTRRIRNAIASNDLDKTRRLVMRNQLILTEGDIINIVPDNGGVLVNPIVLVKFRQMTSELIRCRRRSKRS